MSLFVEIENLACSHTTISLPLFCSHLCGNMIVRENAILPLFRATRAIEVGIFILKRFSFSHHSWVGLG